MLLRIRDTLQGQKWVAWVILGGIGLTFVFWGGSRSLDFKGVGKTSAAEVNGIEIPASEAMRAWSEMQARWSRQFGTDIPDEQRVAMQKNIIDGLVLRKRSGQRQSEARSRRARADQPLLRGKPRLSGALRP